VRAVNTLPNTPSNRKEWANDTRRIDLEGVDTPIVKGALPKKETKTEQPDGILSPHKFKRGLSFDEFKKDAQKRLKEAEYKGNKKEIIMLARVLYLDYEKSEKSKEKYIQKAKQSVKRDFDEINTSELKKTHATLLKFQKSMDKVMPEKKYKFNRMAIDKAVKDSGGELKKRRDTERDIKSNYIELEDMWDTPHRKLSHERLDPTVDYLPKETDNSIQHVITVKDRPSMHDVVYDDKYIMLAQHSAKKRGIKPIPTKH
ncbi:hypothetical protein KAR91_39975, partial [Candidatus Pacearchaeota archaeon]|nr:hypothetical protein [Candidatus Pacearchaeota archaeon]